MKRKHQNLYRFPNSHWQTNQNRLCIFTNLTLPTSYRPNLLRNFNHSRHRICSPHIQISIRFIEILRNEPILWITHLLYLILGMGLSVSPPIWQWVIDKELENILEKDTKLLWMIPWYFQGMNDTSKIWLIFSKLWYYLDWRSQVH